MVERRPKEKPALYVMALLGRTFFLQNYYRDLNFFRSGLTAGPVAKERKFVFRTMSAVSESPALRVPGLIRSFSTATNGTAGSTEAQQCKQPAEYSAFLGLILTLVYKS